MPVSLFTLPLSHNTDVTNAGETYDIHNVGVAKRFLSNRELTTILNEWKEHHSACAEGFNSALNTVNLQRIQQCNLQDINEKLQADLKVMTKERDTLYTDSALRAVSVEDAIGCARERQVSVDLRKEVFDLKAELIGVKDYRDKLQGAYQVIDKKLEATTRDLERSKELCNTAAGNAIRHREYGNNCSRVIAELKTNVKALQLVGEETALDLARKVLTLTKSNSALQHHKEVAVERLKSSRFARGAAEREVENLQSLLDTFTIDHSKVILSNEQFESMQGRISEQDDIIASAQESVTYLRKVETDQQQTLKKYYGIIRDQKDNILDLKTARGERFKLIERLEADNKSLEGQIEDYSAQVQGFKESHALQTQCGMADNVIIGNLKKTIQGMQEDSDSNTRCMGLHTTMVSNLRNEVVSLKGKVSARDQGIDLLEEVVSTLKEEKKEYKHSARRALKRVEQLESFDNKFTHQIGHLSTILGKQKGVIRRLRDSNHNLGADNEDLKSNVWARDLTVKELEESVKGLGKELGAQIRKVELAERLHWVTSENFTKQTINVVKMNKEISTLKLALDIQWIPKMRTF